MTSSMFLLALILLSWLGPVCSAIGFRLKKPVPPDLRIYDRCRRCRLRRRVVMHWRAHWNFCGNCCQEDDLTDLPSASETTHGRGDA